MNYQESVRSLMALGRELASPRQARVQKFGLENISTLAREMGYPHLAVPCVHVGGTNGKGSTAAMLESILRAAGFRTGLYTSPHLERINERIRIRGEEIDDELFAEAWTRVHGAIESLLATGGLEQHPTFFECVTAMAFSAFASQKTDIAVYEVGMGGRFDATNIVQPEVTVITPIDFDHENFLGHSIEEIAAEKAGIVKHNVPVVSSIERPEALAVVQTRAKEMGAPLVEVDSAWRLEEIQSSGGYYRASAKYSGGDPAVRLKPALAGRFQIRNALAAATAAQVLNSRGFSIAPRAIERGIASVRWPGRLEKLGDAPSVYLDGAHNPAAARELLNLWDENFAGTRIVLVYGTVRDKAVDEIAGILFPRADLVIFTEPRQPRAISAELVAEMVGHLAKSSLIIPDAAKAVDEAMKLAKASDAVFITGSLYLVGEIRSYWRSRNTPDGR